MAYSKGVNFAVPAADAVANDTIKQAIGNKTDAGVVIPGTESSLMAYLKGNARYSERRLTPVITTNFIGSSQTSYKDIVNISDYGVLKCIWPVFKSIDDGGSPNNFHVKIIIDGSTVFDDEFCHCNNDEAYPVAPVFDLPFDTSLQVQAKWAVNLTSGTTDVNVVYFTD